MLREVNVGEIQVGTVEGGVLTGLGGGEALSDTHRGGGGVDIGGLD